MTMKVDGQSPRPSRTSHDASARTYTVKSGDSMWAIAQSHGMSLKDLTDANPQVKNPSLIMPGQELHLPASQQAKSEPAATGPEKRHKQDPAKRRMPPPGVDPAKIHAGVKDKGGPGNDLVPNQFSLGGAEGGSACGPAALVALEKAKGKDISLPGALSAAKQHGWTVAGGMNGFGNFEALARSQGLDFKTGSQADIKAQVEKGNPVVISTNQHYFVAQAYDPNTGKFFFGNSGTALRAGSQWLSLDQVQSLGHGINGVGWAA